MALTDNGWMSRLEDASIPLVGSMMQDVAIQLDRPQQKIISAWCMKTAFLTDWTRIGGRQTRFYTRAECTAFAHDLTVPQRTRIWVGCITSSHISTDGHDLTLVRRGDGARMGISTAVSIVVGHFVAQIVTDHLLPEFAAEDTPDSQPKTGPWANKLIQMWPIEKEWVMWPPRVRFTNGGRDGYAYLMNRWRAGEQVDKLI